MNNRDPNRAQPILHIGALLAAAYLRLRFPEPPPQAVDCAEMKSDSLTVGEQT